MKLFPSKILNYLDKKYENVYPILFYGSECGLISDLIKSIYNNLQKKIDVGSIKYFDHKNDKKRKLEYTLKNSSLFSKINFIVIKNPQDRLVTELENIDKIENILIINGENLRSKSSLKLYFDNHQSYIGVPCYQLNKNDIKKTVDDFLKNNNITLQNKAYWFLIDNISEDYLVLKNELQKLHMFKNSSASLEKLRRLIVQKNNINTDNYFFNCANGNFKLILQEINSSNKSINESYEIFTSLKRFINILSNAVLNKDSYVLDDLVKKHLPKYLFLKKEIFKEILRKTDTSKIAKINKILQKTEYLLRKNSNQHREILERFLFNLTKIMR